MLAELNFVKGAIAKKDFIPALTHFCIKDGKIQGFNGSLSLQTPINLDIDAQPKAIPFIKAISQCKEESTALYLTEAGRLAVKSGSFKAFIDCTTDTFPAIEPVGQFIELDHGILEPLKILSPFIAEDASRPWATGVLFRGQSAFATNNIILCEQWLGYTFPREVNIPVMAIKELLRIGEEPKWLQISENLLTFYYSQDKWLTTNLCTASWPDLSRVLDVESSQEPLPENFFPALEDLAAFSDEMDSVYILDNEIRTSEEEGIGAAHEVIGLHGRSKFQIKQLLLLKKILHTIDLRLYPKPCLFFGDKLRGAISGLRT